MKKKSLVFLFIFALVAGSLFSTNVAEASKSVSQLEKEIKTLKATNAKQKKHLKEKDKQIKSQKSEITKKNKTISDLNKKLTYSVTPLKTKVAYQGNEISGNYQLGNSSVPAVLDYKGIKYSPVNMLGDLLSAKTTYNKSENTVFFGAIPNGSYMSDLLKPYYSTEYVDINQSMEMGGQKFNKGYSIDVWNSSKYAVNLAGKYSNITGLIGLDDSESNEGAIVYFYGDKKLIGKYILEEAGLPINIDLDVTNIKKLEVKAESNAEEKLNLANLIIN